MEPDGDHRIVEAYPHGRVVQFARGAEYPHLYVFPVDGPRNLPRSAAALDALLAQCPGGARCAVPSQADLDAIHEAVETRLALRLNFHLVPPSAVHM